PGADTTPAITALLRDKFSAEMRWNANNLVSSGTLIPGHTYRVQVMDHDGDQHGSAGDSGEACVALKIPPVPAAITTQPDSATPPDATGPHQGGFLLQEAVNGTIFDIANPSNASTGTGAPPPTGNVTFRLYFVPLTDLQNGVT